MKLLHQPGFAPGSIARVNRAPAGGFVQVAHGGTGRGDSIGHAATGDIRAGLLDQCAGAGAICAVVDTPFFILADAF